MKYWRSFPGCGKIRYLLLLQNNERTDKNAGLSGALLRPLCLEGYEVHAMIKPIMKDPIFLAQKSAPATMLDLPVAQDLRDTLEAHRDGCVGMAANMIGVSKRIIIFDDNGTAVVMFLSLSGTRKAGRFRSIKVQYQNERFETRLKTYTGWTAQIIQHEIDHCGGILI